MGCDGRRENRRLCGPDRHHEAYEAAAGNDAVITQIVMRQSADLTADVGAASAGAAPDRAAVKAPENPTTSQKVIMENARSIVAREDADSRDTLQRIVDVLEQYRSIEGRKTVLFFSEGFEQPNLTREMERVAAAAAESYAVFYAFDLTRRQQLAEQATLPATTEASEISARMEPLGNLASETDGVFVPDAASHLEEAMTRLADQTQDYYLVGFSPSAAATASPGTYRRVSIRVNRPGARVSARTGYAVATGGAPVRRAAIDAALAAPFSQQALRVAYTTYTMHSGNPGRARVILSLETDLPLRDGTNGMADVVFVVRDLRDGRVVASGTAPIPLPSTAAAGASTGVGTYRVHFEMPPGSHDAHCRPRARRSRRQRRSKAGCARLQRTRRDGERPDSELRRRRPSRARAGLHAGRPLRRRRNLRPERRSAS